MKKKSQVTLFIVLGLVLLLVVSFLFSVLDEKNIEEPIQDPTEVTSYIEQTLTISAKHCLHTIGLQGGVYKPSLFVEKSYGTVEYGFYNTNIFPTDQVIREELKTCLNEVLPFCLDEFNTLKRRGMVIQSGLLQSEVVLAEADVPVIANFDVDILIGTILHQDNYFRADPLPIRLQTIQKRFETFSKEREKQNFPSDFDLTYLGSLAMNTTILEEDENTQIMKVVDHFSTLDTEPYIFLFASAFTT